MKQVFKNGLLLLAVAVSAVVGWSFFWPSLPTLTAIQSASNAKEYAFSVSPLPGSSGHRILLYHGDGTFFLGTASELISHRHTYPTSQTYTAFAEAVGLYDDDVPPKRTAPISVTPGTTGTHTSTTAPLASWVLLRRDVNAVPGDSITYIATCENKCPNSISGKIRFKFDDDKFDYIQTDCNFDAPSAPTSIMTSNGLEATVELDFTNLAPGAQLNALFLLETSTGVSVGAPLNIPPTAELQITQGVCKETTYTDQILGQTVVASHDPNYVESFGSNDMCKQEEVTWRVHFQNYGNAPEDSVQIYCWIDTLLDFNSVKLIGGNPYQQPQITETSLPDRRIRKYVLYQHQPRIDLKGTKESPVPQEEDTRGYIELQAKRRITRKCNAILSRARIHFSCNPPIETNTMLTPFPCTDTCNTCIPDTIVLPTQTLAANSPLIPPSFHSTAWYAALQKSDTYLKWYPSEGISGTFQVNPTLDNPIRREYILVASYPDTCLRTVVKVPVTMNCPLRLNIQQTLTPGTDCTKPTWDVTVTAVGANAANLLWNYNCLKGVSSHTWPTLSEGVLYVSVWDITTGCSVEKWIKVGGNCGQSPPWSDVTIFLAGLLVTAIAFLLYRIFRKQ